MIKKFLDQSLVYFIGNALNNFGVFLLLPLYTNYLTPKEYGTLELVLVTVAFAKKFIGMRISHATLRFYFEYDNENDRKKLVSTSVVAITLWCLLLVLILITLSNYIAKLVSGSEAYNMLFIFGFSVMFFEVINEIPFALLRAREQSVLYVATSLLQLFLRVALNIYIVKYLHGGVKGILTGNMLSAAIVWFLLLVIILKYSRISFDISKLRDLWKYSYPLIIAMLPGLAVQNADRFFLSWYGSLEVVGIYALAIRFGSALSSFVLEPFQLGFGPFRFKIMNQDNAQDVYSRLLTYFFISVTFIGLLLAILSREVIEIMSSESFRSAYKVVPIIIFASIISGITYIIQTGLLIGKKTGYFPYIAIATTVVNILSLLILVPLLGIYGAAAALVLTAITDTTLTYKFSQKLYKVNYEYQRLVKIIVAALFIYYLSTFTFEMSLVERLFVKTAIILIFPLLLVLFRFYTNYEIEKFFILKDKVRKMALSAIEYIRR